MPVLQVEDLSAHYGGVRALAGVSIQEFGGEIVAMVGGNGAGKTTLLNAISGFVKPSSGRIFFDGKDITSLSPEKIVAMGIGQVPEGRLIFGPLSVRENLELGAYCRKKKKEKVQLAEDFEYVLTLFPVLRGKLEHRAGTLSGGEQQMLAIGRGLMAKPRLMLFDEPSLGLAPLLVREIFSVISRLKAEGKTTLLVEQNARAALKISDRAYVIETGRIKLHDKADLLLESEEVKKAYLGQKPFRGSPDTRKGVNERSSSGEVSGVNHGQKEV